MLINSPYQHLRISIEDSVENMYTDVSVYRVKGEYIYFYLIHIQWFLYKSLQTVCNRKTKSDKYNVGAMKNK